ncbi:MAG: single-stranded DNA-binding protein [Nocardioidaceae bacterium]|nr:single-stranded DNA-binding protein [Nocardioidaceae bacterium]
MNEAFVTFQGWVGNDVQHRETTQGNVANFRVGSTPRIRRRSGEWVDGKTSWFSVSCWRGLADNVRDSVRKGEPVVVHGRLRTDVWEREDGQTSTTYVVDAVYVGHDLSRGTAAFLRSARVERAEVDDDGDPLVKELLHQHAGDLPQLDSLGQVRPETEVA